MVTVTGFVRVILFVMTESSLTFDWVHDMEVQRSNAIEVQLSAMEVQL